MLGYVYIIYSASLDRFYIGSTGSVRERVVKHNTGYYKGSSTRGATDWELFLEILCEDRFQARQVEAHIKRMKSRKYIVDLKTYPEIIERLLEKYQAGGRLLPIAIGVSERTRQFPQKQSPRYDRGDFMPANRNVAVLRDASIQLAQQAVRSSPVHAGMLVSRELIPVLERLQC